MKWFSRQKVGFNAVTAIIVLITMGVTSTSVLYGTHQGRRAASKPGKTRRPQRIIPDYTSPNCAAGAMAVSIGLDDYNGLEAIANFRLACSGSAHSSCGVTYNKEIYVWSDAVGGWVLKPGTATCQEDSIACGNGELVGIGQGGLLFWDDGTYLFAAWVDSGTCANPGTVLAVQSYEFTL